MEGFELLYCTIYNFHSQFQFAFYKCTAVIQTVLDLHTDYQMKNGVSKQYIHGYGLAGVLETAVV